MDQKTLNEILKKHSSWLRNEPGGTRANLCEADLCEADLCEANLREANLCGANLRGANLRGADLCGADLRGADLCGANLYRANLREANLCGADLYRANLREADLCEADLCEADLRGANLREANLREANLCGAENVPYIPMACPDTGEFIAWKKAFSISGNAYLVKLLIPEDARRSSATGRKCRADKAEVLAIEPIPDTLAIESVPAIADRVRSRYDPDFYYQVGQCITIPDFDTDRFNECAPGIHFFINRQEAIDYCFT